MPGGTAGIIVIYGLFFAALYFILIRPQRKKQEKVRQMQQNLKAGDRITTIGGIVGRIQTVREDELTLDVGGNTLTFKKWAVGTVENNEIK